jgi:hypothetical protein
MHGGVCRQKRWLNDLVGRLCLSLYAWFDYGLLYEKHWEVSRLPPTCCLCFSLSFARGAEARGRTRAHARPPPKKPQPPQQQNSTTTTRAASAATRTSTAATPTS